MGIEITTEPIDVSVEGTKFFMQGDPSNTPEWVTLMELRVTYGTKRDASREALIEALAGLAHSDDDASIIRDLTVGTATLERTGHAYVQAVTGFPTQPPAGSTKTSRRTGGN